MGAGSAVDMPGGGGNVTVDALDGVGLVGVLGHQAFTSSESISRCKTEVKKGRPSVAGPG